MLVLITDYWPFTLEGVIVSALPPVGEGGGGADFLSAYMDRVLTDVHRDPVSLSSLRSAVTPSSITSGCRSTSISGRNVCAAASSRARPPGC